MHLNHKTETTRLNEIVSIRNSLNDIFEKNTPQIWTGDFNALTKDDYSSDQWNEITEVRAKDNWELPQTDLTEKIKEYGFKAGDTAMLLSVHRVDLQRVSIRESTSKTFLLRLQRCVIRQWNRNFTGPLIQIRALQYPLISGYLEVKAIIAHQNL